MKRIVQYYVEGDDEKHLLSVLKGDLKTIVPGKVQRLNVVDQEISDAMIRAYKENTFVVLVFDTDTDNVDILNKNINKLKSCKYVSAIITIPQVLNLEDELVRSCNIKHATELLNSRSGADFKRDLIRITNLSAKLIEHNFDINKFWNTKPHSPYQNIENLARIIKLK